MSVFDSLINALSATACDKCKYIKSHCRCPKPNKAKKVDLLTPVIFQWVKSNPLKRSLFCPNCNNEYLTIRRDIYKDRRDFVYCDCCGFLAEPKYTRVLMEASEELKCECMCS